MHGQPAVPPASFVSHCWLPVGIGQSASRYPTDRRAGGGWEPKHWLEKCVGEKIVIRQGESYVLFLPLFPKAAVYVCMGGGATASLSLSLSPSLTPSLCPPPSLPLSTTTAARHLNSLCQLTVRLRDHLKSLCSRRKRTGVTFWAEIHLEPPQ